MASGLNSRSRQNLCQPAEFLLRALFSRGCRDKAVPHGTTPPATKGDRRRAAVVGRAWQTGLVVHCHFGGRCNQCRSLSAIWSVGRLPSPSSTPACTSYLPGAMRLCTACTSTGGSMAAAAQTHPPYWPSALRLHRGERLRYVYDFGAHVNMNVDRRGCIELHVHEKVQFDRLQPTAADGYVAEQHGARCSRPASPSCSSVRGCITSARWTMHRSASSGRRPGGQHECRRQGQMART